MPMWNWVKGNLEWILPLCMPVGFLIVNAVMKLAVGRLNLHLLGADTALCGSSLFSAILLRQISIGALNDGREIATSIIVLLLFLFGWMMCMFLGRAQKIPLSLAGIGLGALVFFLSQAAAWHILSLVAGKP